MRAYWNLGLPAYQGLTSCLLLFWELKYWLWYLSVQFTSVAQSCLTLCDPMDCSTLGLPVYHQFPELTQTHVHWVGDAIQPSHPLLSPSPLTFNISQHQGLFQWVSSLHQVTFKAENLPHANLFGWNIDSPFRIINILSYHMSYQCPSYFFMLVDRKHKTCFY